MVAVSITTNPSLRGARAIPPAAGPPRSRRRGAERRSVGRDALQVLAGVSLVTPVAVWLGSGGLARFGTLAGAVTALGIVAGLIATALVVLLLWLAARVPFIDRTIGQDRAIALHRRLGQWTFIGLVAHGVFLVVGYALADGVGPVAEFVALLGVRDFLLVIIGIGLLLGVSLSSLAAMRRKLPFEVWHLVHLAAYAAVLLSLPHQFSMGGLFESGVAHGYWVIVWLATFGALLVFRVFLPLFTSLDHSLVVTRVDPSGADVVSITMTGHRLDDLRARGGQYLHWRFLAPGLWWHQHPFSLSAQPTNTEFRISVRNLGAGSAALLRVRPGTRVMVEGPYGLFSDAVRACDDVVLVGIGIGIAPIRALLEETRFAPGRATVILRASTAHELYLLPEMEELCRTKGARIHTLVGGRARDAAGNDLWLPEGRAPLRLADLCPRLTDADVYVCGPAGAADLVIGDARAGGVPDDRIHCERFAW